jgi:hypothetical protein
MLRIMVLVMLYALGMIAALPHVIAISRLTSTCTNMVPRPGISPGNRIFSDEASLEPRGSSNVRRTSDIALAIFIFRLNAFSFCKSLIVFEDCNACVKTQKISIS